MSKTTQAIVLGLLFSHSAFWWGGAVAYAQGVDHAHIEALFARLEKKISAPPLPPETVVKSTVPPVPAPDVATDFECEKNIESLRKALQEAEIQVADFEDVVVDAMNDNESLAQYFLDWETSRESGACPKNLVTGLDNLREKLQNVDLAAAMSETDAAAQCAQNWATEISSIMDDLAQSADPNDQFKRNAQGVLLDRVAALDGDLTNASVSLVSFELKLDRLVRGVERYQQQCAVFNPGGLAEAYD